MILAVLSSSLCLPHLMEPEFTHVYLLSSDQPVLIGLCFPRKFVGHEPPTHEEGGLKLIAESKHP